MKNNKLIKSYIEAIGSQWKRLNIQTVDEAIHIDKVVTQEKEYIDNETCDIHKMIEDLKEKIKECLSLKK